MAGLDGVTQINYPGWQRWRFKELYHLTPRAYLERIRMAIAWDLLTTERQAVVDVARETGYTTADYFSRSFRRYFAKTLSDARKEGRDYELLAS